MKQPKAIPDHYPVIALAGNPNTFYQCIFNETYIKKTASDAAGRGKAADPCFFTRFYIVQTKRGSHKNITCLGSYLYLLYDTKGQKVKNPMQAVKIAGKLKKDGL